MSIHVKIWISGYIIFYVVIFWFSEGGKPPPPQWHPWRGVGGNFFSGMGEGYYMIIHVQIRISGCNIFLCCDFLILRGGQPPPPPHDTPEGGGGVFFSEMREGYYMIIHVKFRFSIFINIFLCCDFLILRGGQPPPPPRDTPEGGGGYFFFWNERGVLHDYTCKI